MTILTALLEATLGAWLIAAVIGLIRLCFRRVLSPKAKYYLWALLALRLMLPVLPESPLSLMNFLPQREAAAVAETDAAAAPITDDPVWLETVPEAAPDQAPAIAAPLPEQSVPLQNSVSTPISEPVPETDHTKLVWQTVVLWIWLGGVGLVLLVYLLLYAITARQFRRLPCVTDPDTLRVFLKLKRDLGIRGKVNLVSGGGGMLGGIFRPTIVIPAELQGQAVAPILVHELLHYKYKDLWVSLLFRVLTAIHWFNPVVWLCFHILRNDSEASCDQRVLESGLVERDRYATVLYEEGVLQMKNSILMQTTFGGDGRSLKRRIRLIAQFRQPKVWMTVLTVVLALIISACTLTGAQSDSPESNQEPSSLEESFSAVNGNPAKADQLPAGMDMDSYIDAIQPGFGHYGWTFQEHLDAGLLDEDAGEWAYQNEYNSGFTTEIELDGMTLEAEFIFSQTLFTWNTDAPQVLTEVLVTVPSDVVDGIQWGLDLMEPWADYMTIAGNDNAANYCATPVNVGTHLTEGQREIAAQMMVEIGRADSLESARDLLNNWAIARGEYKGNQGVWQFNGTGAALIAAANRNAPSQPESTSTEEPTNTEPLTQTISPYVPSGDGITYGDTQWGMTTEQVFAAEKLDEEAWRYVSQSQSITPREEPVLDHTEVTDLVYYFNYTGPELEFGLNLVLTRYDAQAVSFDQLVAQRTQELGVPGFQDETKASWEFPDGTALLLINDEEILDERLTASMSQFADGTLQNLDVEAYMEDLQAPNGHFGWSFERHVDAGLLDPNAGTLESRFEEDDSSESLYFHTTTLLGGYEVPITYLFHKTLVSEEAVLTQVFVTPPEGVIYREWVESFWDPWKNKLYEQSSLRFTSPVMLSSLLPEETQRALIDQLNARGDRTDATLTNWPLMCCWYEASANFWQFNGTGAALYLTATEAE